jgi:hypothetical protein
VPKNWNLFLFGDQHIGASLWHQEGFNELCDMLNSPYDGVKKNYAIDHGDVVEAITIDDKRFSVFDTKDAVVLSQIQMVKRRYSAIKDKILIMLDGNHPYKLHKFGPITHHICQELGVDYGTYTSKVSYYNAKSGKLQFKHLCTHGWGTIASIADDPERRYLNWKLTLKRKLRDISGDALLMSMGHTHKLFKSEPTKVLYLTDDGKKIKDHYTGSMSGNYIHPDYRYYVNTGSFLKLYSDKIVEDSSVDYTESELGSGYAERAMYPPNMLGFAIVKIRNNDIKGIDIKFI